MSQSNDDDFLSRYVGDESSTPHGGGQDPGDESIRPDPLGLSPDPEGTNIIDRDTHARMMREAGELAAQQPGPPSPVGSVDEPTTIGGFPPISAPRHGQPGLGQGRHTQPPQPAPAPHPGLDHPFHPEQAPPVPQWPAPQFQQGPPPQPPQPSGQPGFAQPLGPRGGAQGDADLLDDSSASVGQMRAEIHESHVVAPYKPVPQTGWRKGLYKTTRINLGLSASEAHWNDLKRRLKVNLRGRYVIAVMQEKGGVTKTTTSAILGAVLAQYRDEKVVAIDANPASGNLASRIDEPSTESWVGLNADRNLVNYSDFRNYLGKDSHSGLEVLGSDRGKQLMTGVALHQAWARLQKLYPIAIVDCGTQHLDDVTRAILDYLPIDALVVPSTTSLDSAIAARDTLNWLMVAGYPHLVREAVVIVSNTKKVDASSQVKQLHKDFERVVRSVHSVGFDPHLSDAVAIDISRLQPQTWQTYVEAAASLADGFTRAAERAPQQPQQAPQPQQALQPQQVLQPPRGPQPPTQGGPWQGPGPHAGPGQWHGGGQGPQQGGGQGHGGGQWTADGRWQGGQTR
ncbi:MinD/ParA family ATP-binding protein [Mycobacteroides abscessus]|uniref:MinD/ParA family ATP-binding protein n=3 Tax=Mycobacteroides abscessus TaxID=36809 RepID=UPI0009C6FAC0|nr:MinD/ParA family protein [Mycobacteroides abscessus]SLJ80517.1 ESX-1 secretion-associated protein EspI [Mycobacteroides abscessus subsp. abscessus]